MDESSATALQTVGASLIVGAIAGAAWFAINTPSDRPAATAVAEAPRAAVPGDADIAKLMHVEPQGETSDVGLLGWPSTSPELGPGDIEVCGFGVAPAGSAAAKELERRAYDDDTSQAALQVRAAMLSSGDATTKAAGHMHVADTAGLVNMAVASNDPTVYAFAMQLCSSDKPDPHCQLLSVEQLARLDPDNAVPWLYLAGAAQQRNDADGVAAALYRASVSQQVTHRQFRYAELALAALPTDMAPANRARATLYIVGRQLAFALPTYKAAASYCSKDAMSDANRQQLCDRLAHVLADKGSTLIDYAIGRRIGEQAGWPAELVENYSARLEAMGRVMSTYLDAPGGPSGCAAMRAGVAKIRDISVRGERFYAESEVQRSGASDADLLVRYREVVERRRAEAVTAAASAAVTAAASSAAVASAPR
jgi:hypothetical protein